MSEDVSCASEREPVALMVTAPVAELMDIFVPATMDVTPVLATVTIPTPVAGGKRPIPGPV